MARRTAAACWPGRRTPPGPWRTAGRHARMPPRTPHSASPAWLRCPYQPTRAGHSAPRRSASRNRSPRRRRSWRSARRRLPGADAPQRPRAIRLWASAVMKTLFRRKTDASRGVGRAWTAGGASICGQACRPRAHLVPPSTPGGRQELGPRLELLVRNVSSPGLRGAAALELCGRELRRHGRPRPCSRREAGEAGRRVSFECRLLGAMMPGGGGGGARERGKAADRVCSWRGAGACERNRQRRGSRCHRRSHDGQGGTQESVCPCCSWLAPWAFPAARAASVCAATLRRGDAAQTLRTAAVSGLDARPRWRSWRCTSTERRMCAWGGRGGATTASTRSSSGPSTSCSSPTWRTPSRAPKTRA